MGTVMDMSSYEIEREEAEYGDEVLCSGWSPVVALACQQYSTEHTDRSMPSSLAMVDAEAFLQTMYAYQR